MAAPAQRREFEPNAKRRKRRPAPLPPNTASNPKTVLKRRKRDTAGDAAMGPKPRSAMRAKAEKAMVVAFRRRALLPPDDTLGRGRDSIPKLARSALHRCLQRHGIARLPPLPFHPAAPAGT